MHIKYILHIYKCAFNYGLSHMSINTHTHKQIQVYLNTMYTITHQTFTHKHTTIPTYTQTHTDTHTHTHTFCQTITDQVKGYYHGIIQALLGCSPHSSPLPIGLIPILSYNYSTQHGAKMINRHRLFSVLDTLEWCFNQSYHIRLSTFPANQLHKKTHSKQTIVDSKNSKSPFTCDIPNTSLLYRHISCHF